MRAVREASGSFVCVELGAGWGPWLVSSASAKHLGISNILLIGVDADRRNLEFTKTHFSETDLITGNTSFFTLLLATAMQRHLSGISAEFA